MSKTNILIFIVCICIGGTLSLLLGQDIGVDLLNYHLYNPYAFLHGKLSIDFIPAGVVHTFFNPLADIPFFWLFYYLNDFPKLTAFIKGGYYGVLLFMLCKWVPIIFKAHPISQTVQGVIIIFSLTGMATLLQVGFSSNEELMACVAVISAYLLFRGTDEHLHFRLKYILLAVFLVSCAAGLKYTAAPAACGVGLCCLFLLIKNKSSYKKYLCVMSCALSGFILTNGYFLWHNWKILKNPLFPFFNNIFKSPFFPTIFLPNSESVPNNWKEYVFLPFLRLHFYDAEHCLDFRLLLGFISFAVLAAGCLYYIKKRPLSKTYTLLLILFIGTYIPWVFVFGNMRYAIFLEILSSLLFTLLLIRRIPVKLICIILIILSTLSLQLKKKPLFDVQHQDFDKKNITFSQRVVIPDDALVILTGHYSALIPFLNTKARYMGGIQLSAEKLHVSQGDILSVQFFLPSAYYQHNFPIRKEIQQHSGPIYILVPFLYWVWGESFWKEYGIDTNGTYCQVFDTNLTRRKYRLALCKVKKL
ncbi:MAG: hypothetical protein ACI351_05060 [Candidatus Avelusimicrobium sp.]|uniref:hypothetical protein n=1 Tax=Candidatus Avelusimicrobium sp. TaxID=3048833 RepID=UPI003F0C27C7